MIARSENPVNTNYDAAVLSAVLLQKMRLSRKLIALSQIFLKFRKKLLAKRGIICYNNFVQEK